MKVLHVITGLNTGGAEMMLFKLCKYSKSNNIEHIVISLSGKGPIGKKMEQEDIKVIYLNFNKRNPFINLIEFKKIIDLIKKHKINIVQGWLYHGNIVASLLKILNKRLLVLWNVRHSVNNIKEEAFIMQLSIKINGKLSGFTDIIINNSVTSSIQHEKLGFSINKTVIIPNGFDLNLFKPNKNISTIKKGKPFKIASLARYHKMKGHKLLIDIAKELDNLGYDCLFYLYGKNINSDNFELTNYIATNNVKNVLLKDEVSNPEDIIKEFNLLLSTSLYGEGFPNIIGEAMASGVPVIASNVGDSSYLVGDTGYVIEPGNLKGFVEAIINIIEMDESRYFDLREKSRQRISEKFSIDQIVNKYNELYRK
jgi:glycosyltransferase involved in cell wall biosynthesis